MANISIVTVAMNRTNHLKQCVSAVSKIKCHCEHIILDFQSNPKISINDLPSNDKRIKLHYAESRSPQWWLTHSYNLAFSLARSEYILKLDADNLISEKFILNTLNLAVSNNADLLCNRLTLQDWNMPSEYFATSGIFLCRASALAKVRGFNPYIKGWGWDEIDLYSRFFLNGFSISRLPVSNNLEVIEHNDLLRDSSVATTKSNSTNCLGAKNERNKAVAIKSISNQITWPSLSDYKKHYESTGKLAPLNQINLFTSQEKRALQLFLIKELYNPSTFQNLQWNFLRLFSLGPYSKENIKKTLLNYDIDFDLISFSS